MFVDLVVGTGVRAGSGGRGIVLGNGDGGRRVLAVIHIGTNFAILFIRSSCAFLERLLLSLLIGNAQLRFTVRMLLRLEA